MEVKLKKVIKVIKDLLRCDRRVADVAIRLGVFSSLMINVAHDAVLEKEGILDLGGELDRLRQRLDIVTKDIHKIHKVLKKNEDFIEATDLHGE